MPKSTFDQHGQSIENQQNAGRDINNTQIGNDPFQDLKDYHASGPLAKVLIILGMIIAGTGALIFLGTIFLFLGLDPASAPMDPPPDSTEMTTDQLFSWLNNSIESSGGDFDQVQSLSQYALIGISVLIAGILMAYVGRHMGRNRAFRHQRDPRR